MNPIETLVFGQFLEARRNASYGGKVAAQSNGSDAAFFVESSASEIPSSAPTRAATSSLPTYPTLREELDDLELFRNAPEAVFDALKTFCPVQHLLPGEALLAPGQFNEHLFVVLSGELLVHFGHDVSQAVVALHRGETVGEISLLDRQPVTAHVTASKPSSVLVIAEPTFWRICQASHTLSIRIMMKLAERLRANNTTIKAGIEQRAKLEEAAHRDALTQVASRRWLDDTLTEMCATQRGNGRTFSVAMVDVDHFKQVNDTYGHGVGDRVLVEIAKTLRGQLRPSDHVARYGGEEFVVILPDTYASGARIACERLADAVRAASVAVRGGDLRLQVTVSMGIAELSDGDDPQSLLERADAALYQAKRNGRDRVEG